MRTTALAGLILATALGGSARAADIPSPGLAKGCTAKTAKAAEPAEVAANPAEFAGKCVSLEGWWRDIALYPSRAEAAQTDALSIVILDQRRVGLYLPKAQFDAVAAEVRGKDEGYCHYKPGVWLAVASVTPK